MMNQPSWGGRTFLAFPSNHLKQIFFGGPKYIDGISNSDYWCVKLGTTLGAEVGGKMNSQERFHKKDPGRICYFRKNVAWKPRIESVLLEEKKNATH